MRRIRNLVREVQRNINKHCSASFKHTTQKVIEGELSINEKIIYNVHNTSNIYSYIRARNVDP